MAQSQIAMNAKQWDTINQMIMDAKGKDYSLNSIEATKEGLSEYLKSDVFKAYYFSPEEIQARNAQTRKDFTEAQKREITIESTEDLQKATETVLFQLIGEEGAKKLDEANDNTVLIDNLSIALEMESAGKDAQAIRLATGWEKGKDGYWKYEIPDIKIKENLVFEKDEGNYKLAKLSDVVDAEELFKAYPKLKNTVLQIQQLPLGEQGNFSEPDNSFPNGIITISNNYLKKENPEFTKLYEDFKNTNEDWRKLEDKENQYDNEQISAEEFLKYEEEVWEKSEAYKYYNDLLMGRIVPRMINELSEEQTITHEIQHAIQYIEGFAKGGDELSAQNGVNKLKNYFYVTSFYRELQDYYEENKSKINKQIDVLEGLQEEYRKEGLTLPPTDAMYKAFNLWITRKGTEEIEKLLQLNGLDKKLPNYSSDGYRNYRSLAGEVEARNVQTRRNMTLEERRNTLLSKTEDVARDEQIVLFENGVMASIDPEVDSKINELINYVDSGNTEHYQQIIADVDKNFEDIAIKYGEDVSGYKHSIDNYFIIHDRKKHGNSNREKENGQIAITDNDIRKIPDVIQNPNFIIFGAKNKQNNNVIIFAKNMEDGSVLYVEEKRTRKKVLAAVTLYKLSSTSNANTLLRNPTLYVQNDRGTINIVEINPQNVNDSKQNIISDKNTPNFLFQTLDDVFEDALRFDDWHDFLEYCEAFGGDAIPDGATAQWYQNVWERAHEISPTTQEIEAAQEEERKKKRDEARRDPVLIDAEFNTLMKKEGVLENFMKNAGWVLTQDPAEYNTEEETAQREWLNAMQAKIRRIMRHGSWQSNIIRVTGGKELTQRARQQLLTLIKQRTTEYRDLFADLTRMSEYKALELCMKVNCAGGKNIPNIEAILNDRDYIGTTIG